MITEGYLGRHYQGRPGGRDSALIDIAQDHALKLLHEAGVFELGVVLKGGTAIRKFRAGNAGRFSTDLDFAGADDTTADLILEVVDGAALDGFRFRIERLNENRRARLHIDSDFGSPGIPRGSTSRPSLRGWGLSFSARSNYPSMPGTGFGWMPRP